MNTPKSLPLLLLLALATLSCSDSTEIPNGEIDISDNELIAAEWQDSKSIVIGDSLNLRMLQNNENLFVGIDFQKHNVLEYRWVELFFIENGEMIRLHASGQLGEQAFNGASWNDEWEWGNNDQWVASKHGLSYDRNRGYEFSIAKSRLSDQKIQFMLSVSKVKKTADFSEKAVVANYPEGSDNLKSKTWKIIKF